MQGLLHKTPEKRLDWPHLLDHPFVKESEDERLQREQRICTAAACAEASRAWKGEGGAIAGAAVYSGALAHVIAPDDFSHGFRRCTQYSLHTCTKSVIACCVDGNIC